LLLLEIVLHETWNSAFIDAEYLRDYSRKGKLGQRNFQQQLRHIRNNLFFASSYCSASNCLFFTLFARERGFTAIAVPLVHFCRHFKNLKFLIDVTIGYPSGCPFGLPEVVFGLQSGCKTTVHYRVYPVSSIPHSEESLVHWLYERYKEKDQLLDKFYRTGSFVDVPSENGSHKSISSELSVAERTLSWNPYWCWMIHGFYLLSTCGIIYVAYCILSTAITILGRMVG
jgi:hypothetical protein